MKYNLIDRPSSCCDVHYSEPMEYENYLCNMEEELRQNLRISKRIGKTEFAKGYQKAIKEMLGE